MYVGQPSHGSAWTRLCVVALDDGPLVERLANDDPQVRRHLLALRVLLCFLLEGVVDRLQTVSTNNSSGLTRITARHEAQLSVKTLAPNAPPRVASAALSADTHPCPTCDAVCCPRRMRTATCQQTSAKETGERLTLWPCARQELTFMQYTSALGDIVCFLSIAGSTAVASVCGQWAASTGCSPWTWFP